MIPGFPITYYPIGGQFPTQLSDDAGKIFVGGIPADATKETLTDYFSQFGEVSDCIIMVDNITGRSRGFGFVTFLEAITVNKVLGHLKHSINGKIVDAKRAVPKGPNQGTILRAMGITSNRADRNPDCKVFVGGVAQGTTESDLEQYFQEFGKVLEVKIPKDQNTQRARGFSFVLFENADCVINATKERFHRINGKMVEVKTVQVPNKNQFDKDSDDGHMRSSPSPFLQIGQRPNYYQAYHQSYLGVNHGMSPHGFYEPPYEPSPSGSTGSAASIGSAGYGNVSAAATSGQRLDEYPYMTPLYPAMNDLSISPQYPRIKNYTAYRAPQYMPSGDQLSSSYGGLPGAPTPSSVAYHSELSSYGSSSPGYGAMGGHGMPYNPASTPQAVPSVQTFSR
ncbi:heterogeneous nuclear ribonucleoprotein A/B-like [Hydractinia symbiolongicarpus]|uniref:heterogeneous nuclear ribonucleoprotein A/B-like n=1 Tax=Hydractinia symbiolongicarpus TaxID=13093 RepID=UPI00254F6CB3|nr:heterogeneous nuclear ribonucleoprotein A/B-like [Hydractinia symbiolongicarpus]